MRHRRIVLALSGILIAVTPEPTNQIERIPCVGQTRAKKDREQPQHAAVNLKAFTVKFSFDAHDRDLILPGSRANVIRLPRSPKGEAATELLLEDVLVVARDVADSRPSDICSLALTSEQAEILRAAAMENDLRLVIPMR